MNSNNQNRLFNIFVVVLVSLTALVIIITGIFVTYRFTRSTSQFAESSNNLGTIQSSTILPQIQQAAVEVTQDSAPAVSLTAQVPTIEATKNPLQPKPLLIGERNRQTFWTPTPMPTSTPLPTPTPIPTFVSAEENYVQSRPQGLGPTERWIDVNLSQQKLVAFEGQIPVFESLVSTGLIRYPTVTGQFRIWLRFQAQDMNGRRLGYDYYLKNVPFVQYFFEDYALHGTFWHNNFGSPMSHGCVNLPTPAAEWLFNWAEHGTVVNIHY